MLRGELEARGVADNFHEPFAWFGDRAASEKFWINVKFLLSKM